MSRGHLVKAVVDQAAAPADVHGPAVEGAAQVEAVTHVELDGLHAALDEHITHDWLVLLADDTLLVQTQNVHV